MGSIDLVNVLLIVVSCLVAHLAPLRLLALSYAVLGPAHYLTQIAWLHDKRYFTTKAWFAPVALQIAAASTLVIFSPVKNASLPACLLVMAVASALMACVSGWRLMSIAFAIGIGLLIAVIMQYQFALLVAVLLPTVVHVFFFTAAFMLNGAKRSRQLGGYASIAALIVAAISFVVMPTINELATSSPIATLFQSVVKEMKYLGRRDSSSTPMFGFLAFAYTYHYLNWFSKVEIIRWHKVPRNWLVSIVVAYVLLLGLYVVNFTWGFRVSLFLSIVHVVLELPLDMRVLADMVPVWRPWRRA